MFISFGSDAVWIPQLQQLDCLTATFSREGEAKSERSERRSGVYTCAIFKCVCMYVSFSYVCMHNMYKHEDTSAVIRTSNEKTH